MRSVVIQRLGGVLQQSRHAKCSQQNAIRHFLFSRLLCSNEANRAPSKVESRNQNGPPSASLSLKTRDDMFLSRYFKLKPGEVEGYLTRHRMSFRLSGKHVVVEECPFCHPTRGEPGNQYKLYILADKGVYKCHRCSAKGSWFNFRKHVGGISGVPSPVGTFRNSRLKVESDRKNQTSSQNNAEMETKTSGSDSKLKPCPPRTNLKKFVRNLEESPYVKNILQNTRGIEEKVFQNYSVGLEHFVFKDDESGAPFLKSHPCFVFPMFNSRRKLVRYKVRSVEKKSAMKLEPKGGEWGLFGLDTVPSDAKEIVLTEGEFDAMAVYQATGRPAVSLPNGASSLPVEVLPFLERFKKIYLWMDDDIPGQDGARQFSKKLGLKRCLSVRSGGAVKDANDALLKGLDLDRMIASAKVVPHEGMATFSDLREEVFNEINNPTQLRGMQSLMIPRYDEFLKGHRRGELTIFSGHTGVGKTTFLSQLSLDYCMQGQPTLWGSFEISNVRLAKLMLSQFFSFKTGRNSTSLQRDFDEWAERFEELPLYFMRYYGSNPIERVLDTMEYANYVHDCSHMLLDNLQFMTSGQSFRRGGGGFDRLEVMDNALEKLRAFATEQNVHVSLVVHPRKENDDSTILTSSIFGTAKSTQEADNVVILQRDKGGPLLDIRKNRFDGSLGSLRLKFNKERKLFEDRDAARTSTVYSLSRQSEAPPIVDDKLFADSGFRAKVGFRK